MNPKSRHTYRAFIYMPATYRYIVAKKIFGKKVVKRYLNRRRINRQNKT